MKHSKQITVSVTYAPLPTFVEIWEEFKNFAASDNFESETLEKDPSCVEMDETPGERVMIFCRSEGQQWTDSEALISRMSEKDYRPATIHEAYAFMLANPMPGCRIVAYGSFTKEMIFVPELDGERAPGHVYCWLGQKAPSGNHPGNRLSDNIFLFVRK